MRILLTMVAVSIFLGLFPVAWAQETTEVKSFSLMNVLPDRTLMVMGIPNISKAREAFGKTNLCRIFKDEEVANFVRPFMEMAKPHLQEGMEQVQQNLGMSLEDLLAIPSGEGLVALVDLVPNDRMMPIGMVLTFQVGDRMKQAMQLWQMAQMMGGMQFEQTMVKDIPMFKSAQIPFVYAIVGDTFVVSSKDSLLSELLMNHQEGAKAGLFKENADFVKVKEVICPTDEVTGFGLYLSFKNLFDRYGMMVPPPAMKMVENIGLKDIQAIACSLNMDGEEMHSSFYLYAPGSKRGIHKLYQHGEVDVHAMAAKVPSNAILFSATRFDMKGLFNAIDEIVFSIDPEGQMGIAGQYKQMIDMVEKGIGFSLKEDLAEALGMESAHATFYPNGGGLFPESMSIFQVKNEEKLKKCAEPFIKMVGLEVKSLKYKGVNLFYFASPLGRLGENPFKKMEEDKDPIQLVKMVMGNTFSGFAFLVEDGELYLAQSAQCLMNYLDWKDSKKPALSGNRNFIDALNGNPSNAMSFLYLDARQGISQWWNSFRVLLRTFEGYIRSAGVPIEPALLPRSQKLCRYFTPSTFTLSADENGLLFSSRGVIDTGLVTVGAIGIGAAVGIPAIVQMKEKQKEVQYKNYLKMIYNGLMAYKMAHGQYPALGSEMLTNLVDKGFIQHNITSGVECTPIPWDWHQDPSSFPLAWIYMKDKVVVLYADGHVDGVNSYQFDWIRENLYREYKAHLQGDKKEESVEEKGEEGSEEPKDE